MIDAVWLVLVLLEPVRSAEPPIVSLQHAVDDFERVLGRLAGRRRRLRFGKLLLVFDDGRTQAAFQFAGEAADELRPSSRRRPFEAGFPLLVRLGGAQAGEAPGVEHVGGNDEGLGFPVECLAGRGDLVGAERRAVHLVGAGLVRRAEADRRLAGDHRRLVGLLRLLDGGARSRPDHGRRRRSCSSRRRGSGRAGR